MLVRAAPATDDRVGGCASRRYLCCACSGAARLIGWLAGAYPWIKSLHIVSMVAWMAGLLYLPRLLSTIRWRQSGPTSRRPSRLWSVGLQRGIMTPGDDCDLGFWR